MPSMSKVTIIGNAARDCELRMTPSGQAVADFSVAVNGGKRGSDQEWVNFYRVSVFGKMGEIAQQYVKKGTLVCVVGDLQERSYTDKTGKERTSLDVRYASFTLLGSRASEPEAPAAFNPDEIPF